MNKIGSWLLVRQGEGRQTVFFMLLFLCMGAGIAIGKGSADALFLKRYGIEYLPYVYLVLGVALALASTLYAAFVDRISAERFLLLLFMIQLLALFGSWLYMDVLRESAIYPAYYVLYTLSAELLLVHGAVYIGQNLNTLQSKRLTSLVFGGYQLGMVLGGLVLALVIANMGLNVAPLAWGACVIAAVFMILWWHRRHGVSPFYYPKSTSSKGRIRCAIDEVRQGIDFTRRKLLLKYASFALIFMVITFYMLSYSAHLIYVKTFASEQELLAFFGVLVVATNVAAMLLQLTVSNRVMAAIGVRKTKLIYPITTVISFCLLLFHPGFLAAVFANINRETIMPAFRNPSRQMFFNVLPDYMKGRARAISIAVVMPVALVLCGALIIIMQKYGTVMSIAVAGLLLSLAYLYFCVRMGNSYVTTLIDSMREKLFLPEHAALAFKDKNVELLNALSKGLASKNDMVSLSYAKVLAESYPEHAVNMILERVQTAEVAVADKMIKLIRAAAGKEGARQLLAQVDRGDAHLKATIYDVVNHCDIEGADELVTELLSNRNERIRAGAIRSAFRLTDRRNRMTAISVWYGLLEGDREMQFAALELIRILHKYDGLDQEHLIDMYKKRIASLLLDADNERRSHVYKHLSYWRWDLPDDVQSLIKSDMEHVNPYVRSAAARCLYALEPMAGRDSLIWKGLDDGHPEVRSASLESLDRVCPDRKQTYIDWLVGNKTGTPRAQKMLLETLIGLGISHDDLEKIVRVKSFYAAELFSAVTVMKQKPLDKPLFRVTSMALEERLYATVDIALLALQPTMDANVIAVIRAGINSKETRFNASACEAMQCLKSKNFVQLLAHLVGRDFSLTVKPGFGRPFVAVEDVYKWCLQQSDPWIHYCGAHAYRELSERQT